MTNVSYFVVSMMLVWCLMVGYLGFLHLKISRLYEIMEKYSEEKDE
ncbi:MAG: hypothetical protein ABEH89_00290 [bacterium]